MKTNQLILAVAALVVLASCTKSNVDPVNTAKTEGDEIGFNAVTQKATKANGDTNNQIITGNTYDDTNTFRIWGWQSAKDGNSGDNIAFSDISNNAESNFMTDLKIEWTTGRDANRAGGAAWRNAENYYYWPFTGKLSFLAIHPYEVTATPTWNGTNKKPQVSIANYTIRKDDSTTEVNEDNSTTDLMFATNEGTRAANGSSPLNMVFKHALSQIEFQVKTNEDYSADVAFDVESITIHNIDLSGDVAYANNSITWTNNQAQEESWTYYNTVLEDITDTYQIYGAAQLMIPQQESVHDQPSTEAIIEGTYLTIRYSMEQTGSDKITGSVNIAKPQEWEAGKKYNYTINFKLNEILFNPQVTDWVDVDVTTINIY